MITILDILTFFFLAWALYTILRCVAIVTVAGIRLVADSVLRRWRA